MDKETTWALYFAGVAAMRCHPRNMELTQPMALEEQIKRELALAAHIADRMTEYTQRRFPWDGEHSQREP